MDTAGRIERFTAQVRRDQAVRHEEGDARPRRKKAAAKA